MLSARCAAIAVAGAFATGCSDGECGLEALSGPPSVAAFNLSCSVPTPNVVLSGPCVTGDAGPSWDLVPTQTPYFDGYDRVEIGSNDPGVCHVQLLFGSGFTYAADVTFATQTGTVSGCTGTVVKQFSYPGPTQAEFIVNVPATACIDAGTDAASDASDAEEGLGVEGGPDGGSDGASDTGG